MHHEHPELVKDQYWDEVFPQELPYTAESEPFRDSHPLPSTANIAVVPNDADFTPSSLKIDGMQSYADMKSDPIMFSAQPRKGSQNSIFGSSVPDSMPRINSISSIAKLKRMFSKEDKDKQQAASSAGSGRRPSTDASETVNLVPLNVPKSLAGEVIEEVSPVSPHRSYSSNPRHHVDMFKYPKKRRIVFASPISSTPTERL